MPWLHALISSSEVLFELRRGNRTRRKTRPLFSDEVFNLGKLGDVGQHLRRENRCVYSHDIRPGKFLVGGF